MAAIVSGFFYAEYSQFHEFKHTSRWASRKTSEMLGLLFHIKTIWVRIY